MLFVDLLKLLLQGIIKFLMLLKDILIDVEIHLILVIIENIEILDVIQVSFNWCQNSLISCWIDV